MKNQGGIIPLPIIVLGALVVIGGLYAWKQLVSDKQAEEARNSLQQAAQNNLDNFDDLLNQYEAQSEQNIADLNEEAANDWEVYTNHVYSYQLSYPSEWMLDPNSTDQHIIWLDHNLKQKMSIVHRPSSDDYNLNTWAGASPLGDISLAGLTGKKFIYQVGGAYQVVYVVNYKNKLMAWEFFGDQTIDADEQKIIDSFEMMSTNELSDWQTYSNQALGYSLDYPKSYILDSEHSSSNYVYWDNNGQTFSVRYRVENPDGSLETWYDYSPVGDIILGGINGKKFEYKYCDGPDCGLETVAYVVKYKGALLGLDFGGDYQINTTEQAIIDSFKFLD